MMKIRILEEKRERKEIHCRDKPSHGLPSAHVCILQQFGRRRVVVNGQANSLEDKRDRGMLEENKREKRKKGKNKKQKKGAICCFVREVGKENSLLQRSKRCECEEEESGEEEDSGGARASVTPCDTQNRRRKA